ncbi:MAG: hydantoinase B/oxoprolinase family protein, partial [Rhodobacterales bacterium]
MELHSFGGRHAGHCASRGDQQMSDENRTVDLQADGQAMIRMGVIHERFLAVAEDIGHILIRGAFSSNIKERRDCSTAIFDAKGRLIAQADHMPIHIGSLVWGCVPFWRVTHPTNLLKVTPLL